MHAHALTERLEQELEGVPFVPLDGRPDLQDFPAFGEQELRVLLEHRPDLILQSAPFLPSYLQMSGRQVCKMTGGLVASPWKSSMLIYGSSAHLLLDAAEMDGEAELVVLYRRAGDRRRPRRQNAAHLQPEKLQGKTQPCQMSCCQTRRCY